MSRVFRSYPRNGDTIQYDTRPKDSSEAIYYVFDFSRLNEVAQGGTITSPSLSSDPAGLTIGPPAVTTVDEIVDGAGSIVAAGKGVKVLISGGTAGTLYALECSAVISFATRVVKGKLRLE